jgi:hypothetical protein
MTRLFADTKPNTSNSSSASDEDKAREVIKKAKVEDDEYKTSTEEQTYYRCKKLQVPC